MSETNREAELLDVLTTEQMVSLVKGGDLQTRHPEIHGALGTTGRTSLELREHGVGNMFTSYPTNVSMHQITGKP